MVTYEGNEGKTRPFWYADYMTVPEFIDHLGLTGPMVWRLLEAERSYARCVELATDLFEAKKDRDAWMQKAMERFK